MTHSAATIRHRARAAFSLVEVLLAIFILAIGIISIAALFPAGIAQQRLANDDFMGPVVANHALSVIRSKISADDFGTFEEFAQVGGFFNSAPQAYYTRTVPGDWEWLRPSVIWPADGVAGVDHLNGAIDIFSFWRVRQDYLGLPSFLSFETTSEFYDPVSGSDGWPEQDVWTAIGTAADPPLHGIPFNLDKHYLALPAANQTSPPLPPQRIITQAERYYPMQTNLASSDRPQKPEYVWDCMFRRFQGRMYVAVFVYRVATPQSGDVRYTVPRNPVNAQLPRLPFKLDLRDANATGAVWNPASSVWYDGPANNLRGPWDVQYDPDSPNRPAPFVYGTQSGTPLDLADPRQAWQENRQWFVDQNNNVYRVLGRSRTTLDDFDESIDNAVRVELSRPLQPVRVSFFGSDTVNPPPTPFAPPFQDLPLAAESPYEYYADVFNDGEAYPDPGNLPQPFFNNTNSFDRGVVTDIHYIPLEVEDADGNVIRLTPVYTTVKEL